MRGYFIMNIHVVNISGDAITVLNAARVSYNKQTKWEDDGRLSDRDVNLLNYLWSNRHTSPFEHVSVTFHIRAPIFVARQWMRHRTQSYNEWSARYMEIDVKFYHPTRWKYQSKDNKQGSAGFLSIEDDSKAHKMYIESCRIAKDTYKRLLDMGIAREQARMVLPVSMYTEFYATANLLNWFKFFDLRSDKHAQYEIRTLSKEAESQLHDRLPYLMAVYEHHKSH